MTFFISYFKIYLYCNTCNNEFIFFLLFIGKPDKVSNCTVKNITAISFYIECKEGYNGGMPQTFYLEVKSESGIEVNVSSSVPRFPVLGLEAKTNYRINVYSMNMKGHSEPINMTVYTLNNLEQILNLKEGISFFYYNYYSLIMFRKIIDFFFRLFEYTIGKYSYIFLSINL